MDDKSLDVFLSELGGGAFAGQLKSAIELVGLGTMVHADNSVNGSITLKFTFKKDRPTGLLACGYKLGYTLPTVQGSRSENVMGASLFNVAKGGALSVEKPQESWNGQTDMFEDEV